MVKKKKQKSTSEDTRGLGIYNKKRGMILNMNANLKKKKHNSALAS